MKGPKTHT